MKISPIIEEFILFWGEMGSKWGVNRSVAQIHALLFLAEKPLPADEIQEILGIARSNVSNSLKELQGWKLVHMVHLKGDRRDHFEAHDDPWDMLMVIAQGRKERELDPALDMLRTCSGKLKNDTDTPPAIKKKINNMLTFMEQTTNWYEEMHKLPRPVLKALMKLGSRVVKFINN